MCIFASEFISFFHKLTQTSVAHLLTRMVTQIACKCTVPAVQHTNVFTQTHTHTCTGRGRAASGYCCKCVIRGKSRQRRIEDTHSPLLRSLCYAVHSGLQGQLSLCKTWQNSSLGRETERGDEHKEQQRAFSLFICLASPVDTGRRWVNAKDETS